jgi:hypothetical protein
MIDVYSWPTPNGHKVHIMLEECGLAYRAIPIDISAGDQFKPEFLAISPNNKIPAIVDADGPMGSRFLYLNPAPFCSISPGKPVNFSATLTEKNMTPCNG